MVTGQRNHTFGQTLKQNLSKLIVDKNNQIEYSKRDKYGWVPSLAGILHRYKKEQRPCRQDQANHHITPDALTETRALPQISVFVWF